MAKKTVLLGVLLGILLSAVSVNACKCDIYNFGGVYRGGYWQWTDKATLNKEFWCEGMMVGVAVRQVCQDTPKASLRVKKGKAIYQAIFYHPSLHVTREGPAKGKLDDFDETVRCVDAASGIDPEEADAKTLLKIRERVPVIDPNVLSNDTRKPGTLPTNIYGNVHQFDLMNPAPPTIKYPYLDRLYFEPVSTQRLVAMDLRRDIKATLDILPDGVMGCRIEIRITYNNNCNSKRMYAKVIAYHEYREFVSKVWVRPKGAPAPGLQLFYSYNMPPRTGANNAGVGSQVPYNNETGDPCNPGPKTFVDDLNPELTSDQARLWARNNKGQFVKVRMGLTKLYPNRPTDSTYQLVVWAYMLRINPLRVNDWSPTNLVWPTLNARFARAAWLYPEQLNSLEWRQFDSPTETREIDFVQFSNFWQFNKDAPFWWRHDKNLSLTGKRDAERIHAIKGHWNNLIVFKFRRNPLNNRGNSVGGRIERTQGRNYGNGSGILLYATTEDGAGVLGKLRVTGTTSDKIDFEVADHSNDRYNCKGFVLKMRGFLYDNPAGGCWEGTALYQPKTAVYEPQ
ncbi:MAG: hypothetical protein JXA60_09670 [Candidatus Coatesbacteria bacterium]|nr:hypothetical protein [Candidatus Coatesbacteria bacterium]